MVENPVQVNNELLSDPRFDPEWKFRKSLVIDKGQENHMQTRNSLDYNARTTRGFNDTSASIF